MGRTIPQIQVDEPLVGDAYFQRERLEVLDGGLIDADRDLSLQPPRVGVLPCAREVVVLPHSSSPPLVEGSFRSIRLRTEVVEDRVVLEDAVVLTIQVDRPLSRRRSGLHLEDGRNQKAPSSRNTVSASANVTPCLRAFATLFRLSHSKRSWATDSYTYNVWPTPDHLRLEARPALAARAGGRAAQALGRDALPHSPPAAVTPCSSGELGVVLRSAGQRCRRARALGCARVLDCRTGRHRRALDRLGFDAGSGRTRPPRHASPPRLPLLP